MKYLAKKYSNLDSVTVLSKPLLDNHIALYQGYVDNVNKLSEDLQKLAPETPEFSELSRRFGWEFNGMRLHELYFENLGLTTDKSAVVSTEFKLLVSMQFGSYEEWKNDLLAKGKARGIGWAVTYVDSSDNRVFNVWVNEHDQGHLTGCVPLLVLDVWEHAYMLDYGITKADYLDKIFTEVNMEVVGQRYLSLPTK